jgi:hypothetical protein
MRERPDLKAVSDDQLLTGLFEVLKKTRHDEADLVAHIAEVDARKLYAREASPSMFAWCTETLHLSEAEAYLRIAAARASRRHPMLLAMLADGRLNLSGIERLAPHLTEENREALLERAAHKTKREIEELVAELAPRPAAAATMRKLPAGPGPAAGGSVAGPELRPNGVEAPPRSGPRPTRAPEAIAPDRFRLQFDLGVELRNKLERLQALMRSSVPDGDLVKIIDVVVTKELQRLEAKRFGRTKTPRKRLPQTDTTPKSRYIPAAVRRSVEKRDGARCTYRDKHGRRCSKRHDLEFHHVKPFGLGGDHSPEGLALMCRTHNALLAEQDYGKEKMARYGRRGRSDSRAAEVVEGTAPGALGARWRSTG